MEYQALESGLTPCEIPCADHIFIVQRGHVPCFSCALE